MPVDALEKVVPCLVTVLHCLQCKHLAIMHVNATWNKNIFLRCTHPANTFQYMLNKSFLAVYMCTHSIFVGLHWLCVDWGRESLIVWNFLLPLFWFFSYFETRQLWLNCTIPFLDYFVFAVSFYSFHIKCSYFILNHYRLIGFFWQERPKRTLV